MHEERRAKEEYAYSRAYMVGEIAHNWNHRDGSTLAAQGMGEKY